MYMLLIIFSLFNVNNVTWGTRDSKTPATVVIGRKQIIFTAFWSKVLDFFYNWYIDSICEDKALHQVWRQNVN